MIVLGEIGRPGVLVVNLVMEVLGAEAELLQPRLRMVAVLVVETVTKMSNATLDLVVSKTPEKTIQKDYIFYQRENEDRSKAKNGVVWGIFCTYNVA